MNRLKPLSAWRDEFTISKASFFSGKLIGLGVQIDALVHSEIEKYQ